MTDMSSHRRLADLRASELPGKVSDRSTLVLPLGAIEQHGPHLPYSTDLIVAEAAATAVVDAVGSELDLWQLPALGYTKSNEHAWNAGTFWISATTMLAVLDDIGRCAAATGAKRLALLNGHGGNTALLGVACRELRLKYGLKTFLLHPMVPPDHGGTTSASNELGMGIHAGLDETSMLLHLRPELVDMGVAVRNVPEALAQNRHVRFGGSVSFGWLSDDFGPSGVIGDPLGATAELGARLFGACVDTLAGAFAEIEAFDFGR
jgi:creatinine amidohydrolase